VRASQRVVGIQRDAFALGYPARNPRRVAHGEHLMHASKERAPALEHRIDGEVLRHAKRLRTDGGGVHAIEAKYA
jgi:hypothetical protein